MIALRRVSGVRWRALWACTLAACMDGTLGTPPAASEHVTHDTSTSALATAPEGAVVGAAPSTDWQRLRHDLSRSASNLRVEHHGGRMHVDLDGKFQSATMVFVDASGRRRRTCLDDATQLDLMLGRQR